MMTRIDGRGVSRQTVHTSDIMRAAPGSASTLNPEPNPAIDGTDWRAGMDSTYDRRRSIAGEYLTRAREDFERAARTRIVYAIAARRHGLTHADIGAYLGVTEGAVRRLIQRHGGDA